MKRPSRRRAFRPILQSLEHRVVLSGSNVGINLDFIGAPAWVNLAKMANPWSSYANPSTGSTGNVGYPTAPASTLIPTAGYPDGDYDISFQGTANITFSGVGSLAGPITTNSAGLSTGVVVVNHELGDGNNLVIQVNGLSASSPFTNFQIDAPGYGFASTQIFTNSFVSQLQPYSTIRFLNWTLANTSTDTTWSTAASTAQFTYEGGEVPWADVVALGNQAQKDIWINIPTDATTGYVQSLAQLIYSELDPNLKVYFEYSNETWAGGWIGAAVAKAAAANPLIGPSVSTSSAVPEQSAYDAVIDGEIFDAAFGAQASRVVPVFSGFGQYSSYGLAGLQFIQAKFGSVSKYIGEYAISPYVGISSSAQNAAGLTLNQIFTDLNQCLTGSYLSQLQTNEVVAAQFGVPLAAYEGGQALVPGTNGANEAVMAQAQNDPRMYQMYVTMMQMWDKYAGPNDLFNAYQYTGGGGNNGFWGMLLTSTSPGSQKWDALMSVILPAGAATLDSTVSYADLQVVEQYYGQTGTWWEQGDFNDAGVTNFSDLNDVRQNIDPSTMTLAEFAQMSLFGQASSVTGGTSLEYDSLGATQVSSMPLLSTSGTVAINQSATGGEINVSKINYPTGLGVAANSSTSIALNGAYSEFDSIIGATNYSASVIFQVYGDGKLLYQSGTIAWAWQGLPIAVNVSGVQTLTLKVIGATTNITNDQAAWADARLLSNANFAGLANYTDNWQLSLNGVVVETSTADSFEFGSASDGNYVLTLTVTNSQGQTGSASTPIVVGPQSPGWTDVLPSGTQVELDWTVTPGAATFDVYRGTSEIASSMVLVGNNLKIPKFVDTSVTAGTIYYYQIAEVDSGGVIGLRSGFLEAVAANIASTNTYLASLPVTSKTGTVVLNRSAVPDSFGDGATMPIFLVFGNFPTGLGTSGNTSYTVNLGGNYSSFSANFGVDFNAGSGASETFVVVADGKTIYTSAAMSSQEHMVSISLSVSGVKSLTFETIAAGNLAADKGDWAGVQFTPSTFVSVVSTGLIYNTSTTQLNGDLEGGPLIMNGTEYLQGIDVLNIWSGWSWTIAINKKYSSFTAVIGVDGLLGNMSVMGFGVIWEVNGQYFNHTFGEFTASTPSEAISLNIAGATSIQFYTQVIAGTPDYDDYGIFALPELHY